MCVYEVALVEGAVQELAALKAFDRNRLLEAIEDQLQNEPAVETRNRKKLFGLIPPFEAVLPVWELRVGDFRLFYDVDEAEKSVTVRAIRHKPPHKTTEEIL